MKKIRVLFIYKYLTYGGVEAVLSTRLRGLEPLGVDAHAWFLFDGPGRIFFAGTPGRIHVGLLGLLEDHLREGDYDLVFSFDTDEVIPLFRKLANDVKLGFEVHTPYPENLEYLRFMKQLPVQAFLVPSNHQAQVLRGRIGAEAIIRVVPNPLAEGFAQPLRPFPRKSKYPIVAWVGRLDDLKNWKEFVEIAGEVGRRVGSVSFWLVGASPDETIHEKLFKRCKRAGILNHMKWFRGFPHQHMPALLDAVRSSGGVVMSTSKGDSFGMTIAEGMARGCPVVVPSGGPFDEFVVDGVHGCSYRLGSPRDGASKVGSLLEDGRFREAAGRRGRESILERHHPQIALQILATELKRMIEP